MKYIVAIFLIAIVALYFTACSNNQQPSFQEALSSIIGNGQTPQQSENSPQNENSSQGESPNNTEGNVHNSADLQDIDYGPYNAVIKAYELDYNIQSLSGEDYEVTGMTLTPTYPGDENYDMVDASGFCYAHLVDFDNNGILELVLIGYDWEDYGEYTEQIDLYSLKHPNIVKIYTIDPDYGLQFLASMPVSQQSMPTSSNYGIEYVVGADKTYITIRNVFQMGDGDIGYYSITDGYFDLEFGVEIETDGSTYINGEYYTEEEADLIVAGLGESEYHLIENLNDIYLEELENINNATFEFLQGYEINNFDTISGVYNNGQFYYREFNFTDLYPPEQAIDTYYRALTMRDYDTLAAMNLRAEQLEAIERSHVSEIHTYVPGYIISDIEYATLDMVENAEMRAEIEAIMDATPYENTTLMYCRVNEVLDPHVTSLGLQVAGGTYYTYFIIYSDDQDGLAWEIAEIIDNKFYW